jgi:hypothetical protein
MLDALYFGATLGSFFLGLALPIIAVTELIRYFHKRQKGE